MSKTSLSKPTAESGSTQVSSGRTIGATTAAPLSLQRKLTVNTPGDKYEQEADRVAEQVMRMPEPTLQRECVTCSSPSFAGGEGREWNTKRQRIGRTLQRLSASGNVSAARSAPPIVSQVLSSTGSPLPPDTKSYMESRFGQDFTNVRIHTDSLANESARELSARAYTAGQHVAFAAGEFQPGTSAGRWLLSHELAHTIQQVGPICRKVDGRHDTAEVLLSEGVSFVASPIGAELFATPDKSSEVLRKLRDGQRVRRVSSEESLGKDWQKIVVSDFLGGGLVGFIDTTVLKTPPADEIANDPGLKLYRVKGGETFWDLVKREYGITGNESTADLNINHFINAIRSKNKPDAFQSKERPPKSMKEAVGDLILDTSHGRDASDTELKSNVLIWIPSYISAVKMDVGSGTVSGEVARIQKKVQQKLNDFRNALAMSGPLFFDAMSQHVDELGPQLINGLVAFAKEAAVILAGSTAVGALIGALIGGAGAIPGATIGFEVGLVILQIYGIYEAISGALGVLRTFFLMLGHAISLTWQANGNPKAIHEAAMAFANAFAILSTVALTALFAYIFKKGFDAIKGTKFAKTVGESKLAEWFKDRKSKDSLKQAAKKRSADPDVRQTHDAGGNTVEKAKAGELPAPTSETIGETTNSPNMSETPSDLSKDASKGNVFQRSNRPSIYESADEAREARDWVGGPKDKTKAIREAPGTVSGADVLRPDTKAWLSAESPHVGLIPRKLGLKLQNIGDFRSFDDFRDAFWKLVRKDDELSRPWNNDEASLRRMAAGQPPYVLNGSGARGKRNTYELDHTHDLQHGGDPYALDDIKITSPDFHISSSKAPAK